jgi:hypothetical protein
VYDLRIKKHVDYVRVKQIELDKEWEQQDWTTVKIQLTSGSERVFAINKEDLSQVLYLLEILSV